MTLGLSSARSAASALYLPSARLLFHSVTLVCGPSVAWLPRVSVLVLSGLSAARLLRRWPSTTSACGQFLRPPALALLARQLRCLANCIDAQGALPMAPSVLCRCITQLLLADAPACFGSRGFAVGCSSAGIKLSAAQVPGRLAPIARSRQCLIAPPLGTRLLLRSATAVSGQSLTPDSTAFASFQ